MTASEGRNRFSGSALRRFVLAFALLGSHRRHRIAGAPFGRYRCTPQP